MASETETVLDRRRLRRRVTWWRAAALVAGVLALGAILSSSDEVGLGGRHIARVNVEGLITEDRDQLKLLHKLGETKQVAGVLLFVNSPGGTTAGGEALFAAIRELAKSKPVVAQFGTIATSAAYIAGLASDHVVAHGNTITGSVGVVFQWAEFSQLLDKVGVHVNEIRSGILKANPSMFQPLDAAGRAVAEAMVADSQRWFIDLVATRRGIDPKAVDGLEQGRIFSGREALQNRLVDAIGGEAEAVAWLVEQRNVPKGLTVVDWKPKKSGELGLLHFATDALAALLWDRSERAVAELLRTDPALARLRLDGLLSIWQGSER
jgi:protease-4